MTGHHFVPGQRIECVEELGPTDYIVKGNIYTFSAYSSTTRESLFIGESWFEFPARCFAPTSTEHKHKLKTESATDPKHHDSKRQLIFVDDKGRF